MKVTELTVCGIKNPLGISGEDLYFGWQIQSDRENLFQTAYRIVVSEGMKLC